MEWAREIDVHVEEVGRVNNVLLQLSYDNPVKKFKCFGIAAKFKSLTLRYNKFKHFEDYLFVRLLFEEDFQIGSNDPILLLLGLQMLYLPYLNRCYVLMLNCSYNVYMYRKLDL